MFLCSRHSRLKTRVDEITRKCKPLLSLTWTIVTHQHSRTNQTPIAQAINVLWREQVWLFRCSSIVCPRLSSRKRIIAFVRNIFNSGEVISGMFCWASCLLTCQSVFHWNDALTQHSLRLSAHCKRRDINLSYLCWEPVYLSLAQSASPEWPLFPTDPHLMSRSQPAAIPAWYWPSSCFSVLEKERGGGGGKKSVKREVSGSGEFSV